MRFASSASTLGTSSCFAPAASKCQYIRFEQLIAASSPLRNCICRLAGFWFGHSATHQLGNTFVQRLLWFHQYSPPSILTMLLRAPFVAAFPKSLFRRDICHKWRVSSRRQFGAARPLRQRPADKRLIGNDGASGVRVNPEQSCPVNQPTNATLSRLQQTVLKRKYSHRGDDCRNVLSLLAFLPMTIVVEFP